MLHIFRAQLAQDVLILDVQWWFGGQGGGGGGDLVVPQNLDMPDHILH